MSDIIENKETEGGRDIVCKSVEDYANLRADESRIKMIADYLSNGGTEEVVLTMMKASEEELRQAKESLMLV